MKLASLLLLAAGLCFSAPLKLGAPLTLKEPATVDKIASAGDSYTGKTVQVKGKVTEVCQAMGCWISLVDPKTSKMLKVDVHGSDIVFPATAVGKMAIAEGKLTKVELSHDEAVEQAKHVAEEQGRKFNPDSVKGGVTSYEIKGTGALILE